MRDRHVFMWRLLEISNHFNTLTLKQIFWKTKTLFKKLEYLFLVESTKIDNATFPYKTALSEANVKTNRMGSIKWTYHKERRFASNSFIFWKFCFSLRTSYKELNWCTSYPIVQFIIFERVEVLFEGAFKGTFVQIEKVNW